MVNKSLLGRLCASACSWKKLCVCQCSVSVQCCCQPKLPRLRVSPATGDPRLTRDQVEAASPPPAYLDIYPEPSLEEFSRVGLSVQDSNLLNPHTLPVFTADIRCGLSLVNRFLMLLSDWLTGLGL